MHGPGVAGRGMARNFEGSLASPSIENSNRIVEWLRSMNGLKRLLEAA